MIEMKKMKKLIAICLLATMCVVDVSAQSLENEVINTIMARRSIRKYLDKPVEGYTKICVGSCRRSGFLAGQKHRCDTVCMQLPCAAGMPHLLRPMKLIPTRNLVEPPPDSGQE